LDFSNLKGGVTLNLASTGPQAVSSGLTLTLSSDTGIENVVGTAFADSIAGNSRDNTLLGADQPDDRVGAGAPSNGRPQQRVFLDFDTETGPGEHVYTADERAAIRIRLKTDYHGPTATDDPGTCWFQVVFTQTQPASGDYVTIYFNKPRPDGEPGGDSSDVDFGNRSFGGTATVQVQGLIGGPGQPSADVPADPTQQDWLHDNWVRASSWIAAHELGHLMGLRHADSLGPIGYGIHTPPGIDGFHIAPTYTGLTGAFETNFHLVATPALTGFTLNDLVDDTFFSEREAIKLAYTQAAPVTPDGNLLVAEQAGAHAVRTDTGLSQAQLLTLKSLTVPNTLTRGLNAGKQFPVGAVSVNGAIDAVGETDVYRFAGRAGDLLNLQVMSEALNRYAGQAIDAVLKVYDASGNVVATSDDEFETHDPSIIDLLLPADGTYYIEVKTSGTTAHDGLFPIGKYELFAFRFDTASPADVGDSLEGRGGNDLLAGGQGDDTYVFNGVNLGTDVVREDARFEAQGVGSRDSRDRLDFSKFGAAVTLDLAVNAVQTVGGANLKLQLSSGLGLEDVVLPQGYSATVAGNARDNTFIWTNRPAGAVVTDTITGRGGMDTLDYSGLTAGVTVDLSRSGAQTVGGGYALALAADEMENAVGSAVGVNTLTGNSLNNVLVGGAAGDTMDGGSGNDILVGNAGDDQIVGGDGDDLLLGGAGADRLVASSGSDILIAGRTVYDAVGYDTAKVKALLDILREWTNTAETITVRRAAIAGQDGGSHLNGSAFLNTSTVSSDASVDKLTGSSGANWFFVDNTADISTPVDTVTGNTSGSYFTFIN
jgi:Ca2+-binding RTX toxin-like protein